MFSLVDSKLTFLLITLKKDYTFFVPTLYYISNNLAFFNEFW